MAARESYKLYKHKFSGPSSFQSDDYLFMTDHSQKPIFKASARLISFPELFYDGVYDVPKNT